MRRKDENLLEGDVEVEVEVDLPAQLLEDNVVLMLRTRAILVSMWVLIVSVVVSAGISVSFAIHNLDVSREQHAERMELFRQNQEKEAAQADRQEAEKIKLAQEHHQQSMDQLRKHHERMEALAKKE